jgi:hypothetical protein
MYNNLEIERAAALIANSQMVVAMATEACENARQARLQTEARRSETALAFYGLAGGRGRALAQRYLRLVGQLELERRRRPRQRPQDTA